MDTEYLQEVIDSRIESKNAYIRCNNQHIKIKKSRNDMKVKSKSMSDLKKQVNTDFSKLIKHKKINVETPKKTRRRSQRSMSETRPNTCIDIVNGQKQTRLTSPNSNLSSITEEV